MWRRWFVVYYATVAREIIGCQTMQTTKQPKQQEIRIPLFHSTWSLKSVLLALCQVVLFICTIIIYRHTVFSFQKRKGLTRIGKLSKKKTRQFILITNSYDSVLLHISLFRTNHLPYNTWKCRTLHDVGQFHLDYGSL